MVLLAAVVVSVLCLALTFLTRRTQRTDGRPRRGVVFWVGLVSSGVAVATAVAILVGSLA